MRRLVLVAALALLIGFGLGHTLSVGAASTGQGYVYEYRMYGDTDVGAMMKQLSAGDLSVGFEVWQLIPPYYEPKDGSAPKWYVVLRRSR